MPPHAPDVVGGGAVFDAFLMQVVDDPRILPGGIPLGVIPSAGKIVKNQPRRCLQIGFLGSPTMLSWRSSAL